MRVGILGGAFNPIHNGHMQMAKAVLDAGLVEKVLLMPCYSHVFDKSMVSAKHRFNMCFFTVGTHISSHSYWMCRVRTCDFEIKHKASGRTIETIKKLESRFKEYEVIHDLIIGADNANNIEKWYKYEELIKTTKFIVIPRKNQILRGNMWYTKEPHCILPMTDMGYSSTEVRALLKIWWKTREHEEELNSMLNPHVFDYIKRTKLYK